MKNAPHIITILLIIFWIPAFAGMTRINTGMTGEKPVLNIQHWQTKNRVPVYFVRETGLPILDIRLIFNVGSARDGKLYGLANLSNSMLNQGAANLNADQIAVQLATTGAQINLSSNRDVSLISLRALTTSRLLDPSLKLLHKLITTPTFPEKNLRLQKKQVLTILAAEQQSPGAMAAKAMFATLYQHNPYAHSPLGTPQTIGKITRQNLVNFYKRYYTTATLKIVIVGAITKTAATKIANNLCKELPQGTVLPQLPKPAVLTTSRTIKIAMPGKNQAAIRIGCLGINLNNPQYFPILVGNHILGGSALTSRLFRIVREQHGLSYGASSSFLALQNRGLFVISLQTKHKSASKTLALSKQVLQNFIKTGPTKAELQLAKQNLIGSFALRLDSNAKIATAITKLVIYNLPLNYLDNYRKKVAAVTDTQISNAFKTIISSQKLVTTQTTIPAKHGTAS